MWIVDQIKEEPVAFQAVIQSVLSLVIGFDVVPGFTQEKMGLLLALSAALLAFFTRRAVTPLANPKTNDGKALLQQPYSPAAG